VYYRLQSWARTWPLAEARQFSQWLAHTSTRRNAGGLICRVRDGYGSDPAAVAASRPTHGIEPWSCQRRLSSASAIQIAPGLVRPGANEWWLRPVSARGLNTSLPRCVHPGSIDLVLYEWSQRCLFSRWVSSLDAFSSYPSLRSCPALALPDDRYTSGSRP
jgi:hypothetical protein